MSTALEGRRDLYRYLESWRRVHTSRNNYKITGGTGKYQGASGGGTYLYENLTDTLAAADSLASSTLEGALSFVTLSASCSAQPNGCAIFAST